MLGKIIFFLIAWSLLKKVVKAIRPEEARLDSGRKEGKRARKDELGQDAAVEPDGPASDMIRVDRADPLAAEVLPGSRPGTCRDCGAVYSLPGDFPTSLARCDACGGMVEVGPMVKVSLPPAAEAGVPEEAPVPEAAAPQPAPEQEVLADASVEPHVPELALEPSAESAPDADAPSDAEPIAGVPAEAARDQVAQEPAPIRTPAPPQAAPPAEPSLGEQPAEVPVTDPVEATDRIEAPPIDAAMLEPEACEDGTAVLTLLGDRALTGVAVRDAFEAQHAGSLLRVEGTVLRVESYGHDAHFAGSTGPRVTLETTTEGVRAVVLLPEGAEAPVRGAAVEAHGKACGHDPYMRALFLAGGGIATR